LFSIFCFGHWDKAYLAGFTLFRFGAGHGVLRSDTLRGAGFVFRHHFAYGRFWEKATWTWVLGKAKLRLFGPGFGLGTIGLGVGHKHRLGEL
jgi:hypothetical protein